MDPAHRDKVAAPEGTPTGHSSRSRMSGPPAWRWGSETPRLLITDALATNTPSEKFGRRGASIPGPQNLGTEGTSAGFSLLDEWDTCLK